ncbi:hypothetical protein O1611_g8775 [Lasiodiplodia mahajangana]|uniref:Uncharacterized protein n=1 Tax=Lasiodiplodia mahajangana TaxID=1108764 RepID=A0ACC2JBJ3_9PEZI|nr:hypothetical protein O1611_g8775 [Lasiodiplodia mahajangana]
MNLPVSLHVDILLGNTLRHLSLVLIARRKFPEAQDIISELEQRLSNGPTERYSSPSLKGDLYHPLFWDNWKAQMLAAAANHQLLLRSNSLVTKALSMVDSNIQLYKDPKHKRVRASMRAHLVKALALLRLWDRAGGKIPSAELARMSKAACHIALKLAQFPNSSNYSHGQWVALDTLCNLLYREGRYHEAKELISRISTDFLPTTHYWSVISVAATAACLGDLDAAEALLERVSMKIQSNEVPLLQSKPKLVSDLITALIKVRPILRFWLAASRRYSHCDSENASKASSEQDYWYRAVGEVQGDLNPCMHELWDILYIRGLSLVDDKKTGHAFEYDDFAFEYARKQEYEAATIVSRSLISYTLTKCRPELLQWGLYYMALSLHFTFHDREALAIYKYMLFWGEKCEFRERRWWGYSVIGVVCFKIGASCSREGKPFSAEFLKLAVISLMRALDAGAPSADIQNISEWLSLSRSALEKLGAEAASPELTTSPKVYPSMRFENGVLRHQSCPDLRGRYFKEVPSHRTAYSIWRKQSIGPT